MKCLLTIALTLFWLSITAYAQKAGALTAEQVLTQMFSVYASCNSYLDEGSVEVFTITKDRTWTDIRPFNTAFIRPSLFYFEYKERFPKVNTGDWKKYIVWEDQEGIHSWWAIEPPIRDFSSLSLALAGTTGVSGGSAYNIPRLLRDDLKRYGHRFQRVSEFKIVGEETVNGKVAYKLEGNDQRPQLKEPVRPITIWIDKQRFLLLKVYQKLKLQNSTTSEDFEAELTTNYHPQINIEIPQERFKVTVTSEGR